MAWIIPAIALAAGTLGSALDKNKQTSNNIGSLDQFNNSSTNPNISPEFIPLRNKLLTMAMDRLNGGGLPSGTVESGIRNINSVSDLGQQNLQNRLLSMGLSRSPIAATALNNGEIARQGQIGTFQNIQIPQLQREFENQNLDFGKGLIPFGMGTTSTNETHGASTGNYSGTAGGNAAGDGLSSAGELLAYLYGKGAFGGGKDPYGPQNTDFRVP